MYSKNIYTILCDAYYMNKENYPMIHSPVSVRGCLIGLLTSIDVLLFCTFVICERSYPVT